MDALLYDRYSLEGVTSLLSDSEMTFLSQCSTTTRDSLHYVDWFCVYKRIIGIDPLAYKDIDKVWKDTSEPDMWRRLCVRACYNNRRVPYVWFRHPIEAVFSLETHRLFNVCVGSNIVPHMLDRALTIPNICLRLISHLLSIHIESSCGPNIMALEVAHKHSHKADKEVLRVVFRSARIDNRVRGVQRDEALRLHRETLDVLKKRFTTEEIVYITGTRCSTRCL